MNLRKITPTVRRWIAAAVFFVCANVVFFWHGPRSDHPRVGMRSSAEIIAPYTFSIPFDAKTIKDGEIKARNAVAPVLDVVPPAAPAPEILPFETRQILETPAGPAVRERARVVVQAIEERGYWPDKFGSYPWVTVRTATSEFRELAANIVGRAEADSIIRARALAGFPGNEKLQSALYYTAVSRLTPTFSYNAAETEARRSQAIRSVARTKGVVVKGERVVAVNEKVTPAIAEKLSALARSRPGPNPVLAIPGTALFLAVILGLGTVYLRRRKTAIFNDELSVYLILALALATFAVGRALGFVSFGLVPLGVGAMLLALVVDLEVSILFTVVTGLGLGFMAGADFSVVLVLVSSALFGSFAILRIKRRRQFYVPALAAGAGGIAVVLALGLVLQNFGLTTLYQAGFLVVNGFLSTVGAIALLPVAERFFGVVSNLTLNLLADLNRPLLQTLAIEAPGTYHHSVIVAHIAEAGAASIRANVILARAGGYYHDIGKLKKPEYFIENLGGRRNPHDKLAPKMSSLIISAHVKDGLDIAKKERLPRPLRSVIAEHHGTTLMEPFFEKAERQRNGSVDYEFRYPGPRPRSKESALVMIADTVEAAARAQRRLSPTRLKKVIKETITGRLDDGQFDDCALTHQDMVRIQDALYPVLVGIFHPRVSYHGESYPDDEDPGLRTTPDSGQPAPAAR